MQRKKSYAANKNRLPHFPKTPDRLVEDLEKRKVCSIVFSRFPRKVKVY